METSNWKRPFKVIVEFDVGDKISIFEFDRYKPRIQKYNNNSVVQASIPKVPKPYEGKPRNFDGTQIHYFSQF